MDFHWQSQLRDIFHIQKQNICRILAFPWLQLKLSLSDGLLMPCFFFPFLPVGIGTGLIANRYSLWSSFRADVAGSYLSGCGRGLPPGLAPCCPPRSDHYRRGNMLFSTVCEKTPYVNVMLHISWLNQTGFWLLVILLLVTIWPWKCLVNIYPSQHHLEELQQRMVNVQREHTQSTAFIKAIGSYRREDNKACLINTVTGHLLFATELEILNFFMKTDFHDC